MEKLAPPPSWPGASSPEDGFADWRKILETAGGLKAPTTTSGAGPRVLIASHTGMHGAVVALDSMLTAALTMRGAEVSYALCDGVLQGCLMATYSKAMPPEFIVGRGLSKGYCKACLNRGTGTFRGLGLPEHRLSTYLTDDDYEFAERWAREQDPETASTATLDGIAVGEHAYAGTLRYYASGDLSREQEAPLVLRRYLEGAVLMSRAFQRLLDETRPEVVVLHHGIYSPQGIAAQVARSRGTRVVTWVVAYRRGCFIFSHDDTYHHTLMDEPAEAWEQLQLSPTMVSALDDYLESRSGGTKDWIYFHKDPSQGLSEFAKKRGINLDKPVVSLLTNVMWDAQIHYPRNAFPTMLDWLIDSIEQLSGRTDLEVVIRVHPAEARGAVPARQRVVDELKERFPRLPDHIHVVGPTEDLSTYDLASASNLVVIFGTKMGVELAPLGIPVMVAGEAWIRNKGLTWDIEKREQYAEALRELPLSEHRAADRERARRYAYHFFFRRMIPLPFLEQRESSAMFGLKSENLEILKPGADPGLDVICDGIMKATPFIYPAENYPQVESDLA